MPTENFSSFNDPEIHEETTPATTQPQPQTVDQYYSNLADTAETNREMIERLEQKREKLNDQLPQQEERLSKASRDFRNSTWWNQGEANATRKKAEKDVNSTLRERRSIGKRLEKEEEPLRNDYYGQTGSTNDLLRATDPTRLREIARANQLNESQGPSVRVSDMTAEQIQERKEFLEQQKALRESGIETKMPLPERETYEQKEARYDKDAVEAFSSSITRLLNQRNEGINSYIAPEYRRKITSEEVDTTIFAEMVYNEEKEKRGLFSIRDLGVGSNTLRSESNSPWNERNAYIDRIAEAEEKVLYSIAMWNMTNEVCHDLGIEKVTSEQFANMMKSLESREQLLRLQGEWFPAGRRYLDNRDWVKNDEGYPPRPWNGVSIGVADFVQTISENIGKSPLTLKKEDIPHVIAYYTNQEGDWGIGKWLANRIGLEYTLEHVFINDPTINKEKRKDFDIGKYLAMYKRGHFQREEKDLAKIYKY